MFKINPEKGKANLAIFIVIIPEPGRAVLSGSASSPIK